MMRTDTRFDAKRKKVDYKKTQFATATFKEQDYPYRLSFYDVPPTQEISLEEFETWAIDRLRILAEIEACSFRNKSPQETAAHLEPLLKKYLPLSSNSAAAGGIIDQRLRNERRKDHYSHFILRLAFSGTEDLRRRFSRVETMLFKLRFQADDSRERRAFVESLNLHWELVQEEEKRELGEQLLSATPGLRRLEDENWFKVEWTRVPELVEHRTVFVRKGKAYVPMREQTSMVLTEFANRLEKGLELTARALPRLDEDDRLTPILNHLSKNFATPDAGYSESDSALAGAPISAANIDNLSQHFPLCMKHLHSTLRKNNHLKHYGRLQYTLFLKGIGLTLEDCLLFWRQSFKLITDDQFNKEYRYNVRHAYGDVGGDVNRRGRGYAPYSCQKILTEHPPGSGEAHGCPYRHFSVDNLTSMLQATGVHDREVLRGVKEDVEKKRFHIACNRVFDWAHKAEIKKVKDEGTWGPAELETIVHPNTYFKRSYLLRNLGNLPKQDVKMEE
ncbi:DNA primase subunit pri2 [Exophiala xenobiotica]|uniref:DNA primase large subunit n=1 Tax=Vermiconidia calcicola TaxID=1690605 RepID=A0AAV9QMF1_9PEZI|nr:DNA primase subunit pri2 [Exophiala xenobiotica]KAK5545300.1 DNA primase subunit pri2 [Vermiconidia calcicola]KAK5548103.1 DNA primase subunit pri2 [Chaetothyriales sp. CCFEE 6169]KAK5230951.1 DNA primase subunit pri2 [Exophiala xenobiotica]KAK5274008.1 DNA primase subunit pri2 [Exophiala xenobiotica]